MKLLCSTPPKGFSNYERLQLSSFSFQLASHPADHSDLQSFIHLCCDIKVSGRVSDFAEIKSSWMWHKKNHHTHREPCAG